jgi:hypothetical protein
VTEVDRCPDPAEEDDVFNHLKAWIRWMGVREEHIASIEYARRRDGSDRGTPLVKPVIRGLVRLENAAGDEIRGAPGGGGGDGLICQSTRNGARPKPRGRPVYTVAVHARAAITR